MSIDVERDHRIWISQKNTEEKSLRKASLLTVTFHLILFISVSNSAISFPITENIKSLLAESPVVILSYASPPVQKLHPHSDIISKLCKPTFHSGHFSHNTSYGGAATIWVFCLPQQRYSYWTQSSMMELPLSVSQYWNPEHLLYY